jgi:hypothetical protein
MGLLSWSKAKVRRIPKLIADKRKRLNEIYGGDGSHVNYHEGRALCGELRSLWEKEEIYWRQRSRVAWLRESDRNTGYFHSCAS